MMAWVKKKLKEKGARRVQRAAEEARQKQLRQLQKELNECRLQLKNLESWYDMAGDPHTVDSCIFQWCALQARYEGLLRQARSCFGVPEKSDRSSVAAAARIK